MSIYDGANKFMQLAACKAIKPIPYKLTNMLTELRMMEREDLAEQLEPLVKGIVDVISKECISMAKADKTTLSCYSPSDDYDD